MTSRKLLAACALATLSLLTPAHADEVDDLLVATEDAAYQASETAERQVDNVVTAATPPLPSTAAVGSFNVNTDYIIIADTGAGPKINYYGTFNNRSLWDCRRTYGGGTAVQVTCDAVAGSGISWQCGIMNVEAWALPRPTYVYDWVRDDIRQSSARQARQVPNPDNLRYGRVAGFVSCDNDTLVTAQANKAAPHQQATRAMGAVTRLTCIAMLSPTQLAAPEVSYMVRCVDPPNPLA